jgi:hypothetical protein
VNRRYVVSGIDKLSVSVKNQVDEAELRRLEANLL